MRIKQIVKNGINGVLGSLGYKFTRIERSRPDFSPDDIEDYLAVKSYTLTTIERVVATCQAAEYVSSNNIPGDIVECGVWRGGSMMAMARVLVRLSDTTRRLYLY